MLKHGILGLLNYHDMTGYEIRGVFKDSLAFFWQAQTSQIYRELKELKARGWVTDVTVPQKGKPDKNVFSVTEAGREELRRWLLEDRKETANSPLLMRTFFRGELTPEENIRYFEAMHRFAVEAMETMKQPPAIAAEYERVIQDPRRAVYWNMTIEYGVMYMDLLRRWSEDCMQKLEEMKHEYPAD